MTRRRVVPRGRQIRCDGLEDEHASVCAERGGLAVALRRRAIGADALLRDFAS